jgi:hypothetical protein
MDYCLLYAYIYVHGILYTKPTYTYYLLFLCYVLQGILCRYYVVSIIQLSTIFYAMYYKVYYVLTV